MNDCNSIKDRANRYSFSVKSPKPTKNVKLEKRKSLFRTARGFLNKKIFIKTPIKFETPIIKE
jgi:hypothetical protein